MNDTVNGTSRQQRRTDRRAFVRLVNEQIASISGRWFDEDDQIELLCECGQARCLARLPVPAGLFRELKSARTRFVVRPGHDLAKVELVVRREPGFAVIVTIEVGE